jgi:hypothetical protein
MTEKIQALIQIVYPYLQSYWPYILGWWAVFGLIGTLVLYIGYGFVMSGKKARDDKRSQRVVVIVDVIIALFFVILDAALNIGFYSVIFLDFRPKNLFNLITGRLCNYNLSTNTAGWRENITLFFASFLNGKDPDGPHVKGRIPNFKWLD